MVMEEVLLDDANEKILSKLDNTIGISQNKNVLRDIVRYHNVTNKNDFDIGYGNYNIIIRNKSSYILYEELISVIAEIYYKNNIVKNPKILYVSRDDIDEKLLDSKSRNKNRAKPKEKDKDKANYKEKSKKIEESIIVVNIDDFWGGLDSTRKDITEIVKKFPDKAFIILEDYYCEGEVNAALNENFLWSMKISEISNKEKESYIKKFIYKNNLIGNDDIIKEIANNPYYIIKNDMVNLLVNCKINNENDISKLLDKRSSNKVKESKKTALQELDELVGLDEAKEQIKKVINYILVSKKNKNMPMFHMCFNGNPRNW